MASNGLIEIRVPDIGNYKDVEVIEVSVKAGDSVALESTLITLETEKATMDVPSTVAGTIKKVMVQLLSLPLLPCKPQGSCTAPVRSLQASPHPSPHLLLREREQRRRRELALTSQDSLGRTRVLRSASSHASWAST